MVNIYAFLWHVDSKFMEASEGCGGSSCESAEIKRPTSKAARKIITAWLNKRQKACKDADCEHTRIITGKFDVKMFLSGMMRNMVTLR